MRYSIYIISLIAVLLAGCIEEKEKPAQPQTEQPSSQLQPQIKPLQTTIPGLDLTKIQSDDYFRQRMDASKQFMQWCVDIMIDPIPLDETTRMFNRNCQIVKHAVLFNHKKLEGSRKYNTY